MHLKKEKKSLFNRFKPNFCFFTLLYGIKRALVLDYNIIARKENTEAIIRVQLVFY